ncbi:phage NrS-1 polymerase family protein [Acidicapsa ligni]|uniref:phage NrS-1 polymerase family protein n=1 Tax=Acidicapsa ligni TaxID=542300 RepID=UPI0037C025A5
MADAKALALAYPDPARGYDASAADSAIAQHLAFWTGKNCERIRNIMYQSKLVRDKWEREDYLPRTILGVVARQVDVFIDEVARRRM